jgi:recombination protein RecA
MGYGDGDKNMKRTIHRSSLVEQVVEHAENAEQPIENCPHHTFIPTGSALLNLALSDRADGGFLTGKIANIIGDSSSGKTFQALTLLAETAHNPAFDNYLLIYDDAEAANEFHIEKLFGIKTAERILPPSLDHENPGHSHTMLDFQSNIRRLLKGDKPFIYIQDSFDALTTDEELKHASELQKAHDAGKEAKGTYGMEKAKQASVLLRLIAAEIKATQSLVIIISQTRDNIDPMSFQRKTRAGGKALYFYASYEMWLAVAQKLSTKINDKNRNIGVVSRIKITKNKYNGKVREVDLPIYYSYGVDDIGACIDYLVGEGHWDKNGNGGIVASELKMTCTRNKLIDVIEEKDWVGNLHKVVQSVWLEIEEKLKLDRKPKYGGE